MDPRKNIWPSDSIQSDGLSVKTPTTHKYDVEVTQYFVVKEGNTELSAKFPTMEQASNELGRLLMESAGRSLRIAVVDRTGKELLRG